jgi:endoglucanase
MVFSVALAVTGVVAAVAVGLGGSGSRPGSDAAAAAVAIVPSKSPAPAIRVVGNHIVTAAGRVVQLHGVNRPGPEYAAAEGWGVFDGPTDDDVSIARLRAWNVNAVRVPLNEDSWLGINKVNRVFNGLLYRLFVVDYVRRLNAHGIVAIINLHLSAPGAVVPDDQSPMADADHSPAFWRSVATTFKANHAVIFDLFNEPYPDSNRDTVAAWSCVLRGGTCAGVHYKTAGMQLLVNTVRATGATQPLMIAGPQYAGVTDRWLQYEPVDPKHQLIASLHIYGLPLDSPYRTPATWTKYIAPLAKKVPVVIGEFGDTDCTTRFSPPLMTWADRFGVSYIAWGWLVGSCSNEPSLITNYNGTPTKFGAGVRTHYLTRPDAW